MCSRTSGKLSTLHCKVATDAWHSITHIRIEADVLRILQPERRHALQIRLVHQDEAADLQTAPLQLLDEECPRTAGCRHTVSNASVHPDVHEHLIPMSTWSPRRPLGPASVSSRGGTSGTCFSASALLTPCTPQKLPLICQLRHSAEARMHGKVWWHFGCCIGWDNGSSRRD
jgi:hypothetical protein